MENILDIIMIIGIALILTIFTIGMFTLFFEDTETFKAIDERVAECIRRK